MSEGMLGSESDTEGAMIEVRNLKTYYDEGGIRGNPVKAVDGVNFSIGKGETLGLVGESGCGKTTLGRTLVQLEDATDGDILFDGADITEYSKSELKRWRKNAQIVFQDPESSLNDRMTVGEIVREPLDVHDWPALSVEILGPGDPAIAGDGTVPEEGTGRTVDITIDTREASPQITVRESLPFDSDDVEVELDTEGGEVSRATVTVRPSKHQIRQQHVRNLLAAVGLQEEHYFRYPHQFSGGQRQRVGIARALALEPEFVVLDEPVSALDVSVQAKILNLLEDLQERFDLTYLFIAHDLSVVRHICDRVAVMYLGNIMELGETKELFTDPANPYTHSLLSAIPEPIPGQQEERLTLRGTPPSPRDPPSGCPFSTRCPAKIRPPEYRDVDEDIWEGIDVLAEIIRERQKTDRSIRQLVKETLGLQRKFAEVDEVVVELFGATGPDRTGARGDAQQAQATLAELPDTIQPALEEIVDHLREDEFGGALDVMIREFGSVCDDEMPAYYEVSETGHRSLCHRHQEEYDSPEVVFESIRDR
jgi:peptide/nickel transport system ATP-binding protein